MNIVRDTIKSDNSVTYNQVPSLPVSVPIVSMLSCAVTILFQGSHRIFYRAPSVVKVPTNYPSVVSGS